MCGDPFKLDQIGWLRQAGNIQTWICRKESRVNSWKKETLRILIDGPRDDGDWAIAANLIDDDLAKGSWRRDSGGMTKSGVAALVWKGPTLAGLEYADDLEGRIQRASLKHRLKLFLIAAFGVAVGILSDVVVAWYECP